MLQKADFTVLPDNTIGKIATQMSIFALSLFISGQ